MQHFFPPELAYLTHFLQIMLEVIALGPSHVLKLLFWVDKGVIPVKYFHSNSVSFSIECNEDYKTVTTLRSIWPPSVLVKLSDLEQW